MYVLVTPLTTAGVIKQWDEVERHLKAFHLAIHYGAKDGGTDTASGESDASSTSYDSNLSISYACCEAESIRKLRRQNLAIPQ